MWREPVYNKQLDNTMIRMGNTKHDKFGQREYILYGNGSYTKYSYDILQRLAGLRSFTANGETMREIVYNFDPVGNIKDVYNHAGMLQNGLGGKYGNHYKYDDLYRLVRYAGVGAQDPLQNGHGLHPQRED